jgi:hypothetical protein
MSRKKEKPIEVNVHSFCIGDVEDPDLYAGQPLWEWQQTKSGKWIMKNSNPSPMWVSRVDESTYGWKYEIRAYLSPKNYTYWKLKFD